MKYTKTIRASKTARPARSVRASRAALRRSVKADEEIVDDIPAEVEDVEIPAEEAEVTVDESATELLFEAEDVAELVAEVTGEAVDVTVDDTEVIFTIGDDEYTVTPEGDEEVVEQSTRMRKGARRVSASRRMPARRPARKVSASRRMPSRRTRR